MNESAQSAAAARQEIAEAVRGACVEAAVQAYEEAGISGLCAEGRWEVAIEAIRHLNLDAVLRKTRREDDFSRRP